MFVCLAHRTRSEVLGGNQLQSMHLQQQRCVCIALLTRNCCLPYNQGSPIAAFEGSAEHHAGFIAYLATLLMLDDLSYLAVDLVQGPIVLEHLSLYGCIPTELAVVN